MDTKLIKQWSEERDAMIETLDVDELKKFVKKWHKHGAYDDMYLNFPSDETLKFDLCSMAWEYDIDTDNWTCHTVISSKA